MKERKGGLSVAKAVVAKLWMNCAGNLSMQVCDVPALGSPACRLNSNAGETTLSMAAAHKSGCRAG